MRGYRLHPRPPRRTSAKADETTGWRLSHALENATYFLFLSPRRKGGTVNKGERFYLGTYHREVRGILDNLIYQ